MSLVALPVLLSLGLLSSPASAAPKEKGPRPGCETLYADDDGDGYGDPGSSLVYCGAGDPPGYVSDGTDCDDADATVNPGADEPCDGVDNDCDGLVDEDATSWYPDSDGDGYGSTDPSTEVLSCDPVPGYVENNRDCDDDEPRARPFVDEVCDGIDNNCDGVIDRAGTVSFHDSATGTITDLTDVADKHISTDGDLWFCTGDGSATFDSGFRIDSGASVDAYPIDLGPAVIVEAGGLPGFSVTDGADLGLDRVFFEDFTTTRAIGVMQASLLASNLHITDSATDTALVDVIDGTATLTSGYIYGNSAYGAVYASASDLGLGPVTISGNTTQAGAVTVADDSTALLDGVRMSSNTASRADGAGHLRVINAHATLTGGAELRDGSSDNGAVMLTTIFGTTASLTCDDAAVLESPDGGIRIRDAWSDLVATSCDFGTGAEENALFDIDLQYTGATYDFTGPTTVTCDGTAGCF